MNKLFLLLGCLALCSCECRFRERIELEFHGVADLEEDQRLIKPEQKKEKVVNYNLYTNSVD